MLSCTAVSGIIILGAVVLKGIRSTWYIIPGSVQLALSQLHLPNRLIQPVSRYQYARYGIVCDITIITVVDEANSATTVVDHPGRCHMVCEVRCVCVGRLDYQLILLTATAGYL